MISPYARRLRLGAELRALRVAAGLTGAGLADLAGVDRTHVSKVETGNVRPMRAITKLIDALLPEGGDRYRSLVRVAQDGLEPGWWTSREYAGMGERQARIADLECGALTIREFQPAMLPGLVQTRAYAQHRAEVALASGADFDPGATLRGRERRQQRFADPAAGYDLILEPQAVMRAPVPPLVMAEQLRHLLQLATRPNIRIRVLPVDAPIGDSYVPRSPFALYRYPDPADPLLVTVDTVTTDLVVSDPQEAAQFEKMLIELDAVVLSDNESTVLIQQVADRRAAEAIR
nr:helix-turn-helix transcriptional regulator [Micromonospora sp. DSM 115978]